MPQSSHASITGGDFGTFLGTESLIRGVLTPSDALIMRAAAVTSLSGLITE